jgi:hypothetical protein
MGLPRADRAVRPVSEQGSVEQAGLQNRDLRSSTGRHMPDGWTRQRPRTAMLEWERNHPYGDSTFVGFVWFVVTLLSLVPAEGAARGRAVDLRRYGHAPNRE